MKKNGKRLVAVLTMSACLAANMFVDLPNAAVSDGDMELSEEVISEKTQNEPFVISEDQNESKQFWDEETGVGDGITVPNESQGENSEILAVSRNTISENAGDDFLIENGVLEEYRGNGGEVMIPEQVEKISRNAFRGNKEITSVVFPDSLKKIGSHAFYGCSNLTGSLYMPDQMISIGEAAFSGCTGLDGNLVLSENLQRIGARAFFHCSGLKGEVRIPDGVRKIENLVFSGCIGLQEFVVGRGIRDIAGQWGGNGYESAFNGCSGVERITFLSEQAPRIGGTSLSWNGNGDAYYMSALFERGLSGLKDIIVPSGCYTEYANVYGLSSNARIKEDGAEGFLIDNGILKSYAGSDVKVEVPEEVTEISAYAFANNQELEHIVLPDGLRAIGKGAFKNCSSLKGELELPELITTIDEAAFYHCSSLNGTLRIPSRVKLIKNMAFGGCSGFQEIIVGEGVKNIVSSSMEYGNAFNGCSEVEKITFLGQAVPVIANSSSALESEKDCIAVLFNKDGLSGLKKIVVPSKSYTEYLNAYENHVSARIITEEDGEDFAIEDGVLLAYSGSDIDVEVPEGVKKIGVSAFRNNRELQHVQLPDSLQKIDAHAFQRCTALQELLIPKQVIEIGAYAFAGCESMKGELKFPDTLQIIGKEAFYSCKMLNGDLTIPDSVTEIGEAAFYGCAGFNGSLKLSEQLKTIAYQTFCGCSGFTGVLHIPNQMQKIESLAFGNCTGFEAIVMGIEVSHIAAPSQDWGGNAAFYNCTGVEKIRFLGENVPVIHENLSASTSSGGAVSNLFGEKSLGGLRMIVVSKQHYTKYASAYKKYVNVQIITEDSSEDFVIKNGVLTAYMGSEASVTIPETVTQIGAYAFINNRKLQRVNLPQGLQVIAKGAFKGCTSLKGELVLPKTLEKIEEEAFYNCCGLTGRLEIPDGLKKIEKRTFGHCGGIQYIDIGMGVENIVSNGGDGAFYQCNGVEIINFQGNNVPIIDSDSSSIESSGYAISGMFGRVDLGGLKKIFVPGISFKKYVDIYGNDTNVRISPKMVVSADVPGDFLIENGVLVIYTGSDTEVTVPEGITEIGPYAFANCTELDKVHLPDQLETIASGAFKGCISLEEITIPDSVTSIGDSAFYKCKLLSGKLKFPQGLVRIGKEAFYECDKLNGDLLIPDSVTDIGERAFYNCSGFNGQLKLSEQLRVIRGEVFSGCNGLSETLRIPEQTEQIEDYAFSDCSGLKEVIMGQNLTKLPPYLFGFNNKVEVLTFLSRKVPVINQNESATESDSWSIRTLFTSLQSLQEIYVPKGCYMEYCHVFGGYADVKIAEIGASEEFLVSGNTLVAYLGSNEEVTVPSQITEIGAYAFANDRDLENIILPDGLKVIGEGAFKGCTSLQEISIPEYVEKIGAAAFRECVSLSGRLELPERLNVIEDEVFFCCESLEGDIKIPDKTEEIGNRAFLNCTGFDGQLYLPENLKKIGNEAFYRCHQLKGNLLIPDNVTDMGVHAFGGCGSFTGELELSGQLTIVGSGVFQECSGFVLVNKNWTQILNFFTAKIGFLCNVMDVLIHPCLVGWSVSGME